MSETSLMEAALELAEITGANAMRYFRKAIDAETKKDGSPVTIADRSKYMKPIAVNLSELHRMYSRKNMY